MTGSRAQIGMLAVTLGVTVACGGGGECFLDAGLPCSVCESVTEPAALQLGGYDDAQAGFVALGDGDSMALVLGPGGGYFLWVSIRAWGMYPGETGRGGDAEDPKIGVEALWQGSLVGYSFATHLGLTVTDAGAERLGIFVIIDPSSSPLGFIDQLVTLRGEITDACGNTATDELDVVVVQ